MSPLSSQYFITLVSVIEVLLVKVIFRLKHFVTGLIRSRGDFDI